jgi:DNA polymerase
MKRFLMLDFETRSAVPLKRASYDKYAADPSTSVLCLGLQIDGFPAVVLRPPLGRPVFTPLPGPVTTPCEIEIAIRDSIPVYAHNVAFDKRVYYHQCHVKLGWAMIPDKLWRCTMALAAYYAYPRALKRLGPARRQSQLKDDAGSRVLTTISKPRNPRKAEVVRLTAEYGPDPENWPLLWYEEQHKLDAVADYCRQDVITQSEFLASLGPLPAALEREWQFDRMLNERGIRVDMKSAAAAWGQVQDSLAGYNAELCRVTASPAFPEGMVQTVSQRDRILRWCAIRGVILYSLTADAVEDALARGDLPNDVRRVLEIRAEAGKSSLAKLEALLDFVDVDGVLRDSLVFHGATTGRWTGRAFQPHNLPRTALTEHDAEVFHQCLHTGVPVSSGQYEKCAPEVSGVLPDIMSRAMRSFLTAREGNVLLCSDFAAIECRVTAWLAGCGRLLQQFWNKECVYTAFAAQATGIPASQIGKKSEERQMGKAAVLGLGYGMGFTARGGERSKFASAAEMQYGLRLSDETCLTVGKLYRTLYPEVPAFWSSLENAAIAAVQTGEPQQVGPYLTCYTTPDGAGSTFLAIRLPSGRSLWYPRPQVTRELKQIGARNRTVTQLSFETEHLVSKRWVRQTTWGGTLFENVVQAASRDILLESMTRVERHGMPVLLSVHDEVIAEGHRDQFDLFHQLMETVPSWATGLPLACESEARFRYGK